MSSMNEFPEIMREARVDLAGNVGGQFSPQDWESILARAKTKLESSTLPAKEAWAEVIRDFHRQNYWGFVPNYNTPKKETNVDDENLGVRMLLYCARSFLLTKVAISRRTAFSTASFSMALTSCGSRPRYNPTGPLSARMALTKLVMDMGFALAPLGSCALAPLEPAPGRCFCIARGGW